MVDKLIIIYKRSVNETKGKRDQKNITVKTFSFWRYSRGQKKRPTRCYSYTDHRREMKLVPFFMVKCLL